MTTIADLIAEYRVTITLPWPTQLSAAERIWMLVYAPSEERRIRRRLAELAQITQEATHGWHEIDITDRFGRWLAGHDYATEFFAHPAELTSGVLEDFTEELTAGVRGELATASKDSVVALIGVGSLFPFLRASSLISAVESAVVGRLLILFPGRHDPATHTFRLLDARDGFNYRARVIPEPKD